MGRYYVIAALSAFMAGNSYIACDMSVKMAAHRKDFIPEEYVFSYDKEPELYDVAARRFRNDAYVCGIMSLILLRNAIKHSRAQK